MKSVLLVEDEQSLGDVLAMILNGCGFRVTVVANGKRALDLLAGSKPDLIITDYMMPVMNGVDMTRAVRANPAFAAIPILMLSGAAPEALRHDSSLFNGFLRKPVEIDVLLGEIARLVPYWAQDN